MRLPPEHDLLKAMTPDELVLRRFQLDASEVGYADNETSLDEGTGKRVLRSNALVWDDDGCSVYRVRVLEAADLTDADVLHPVYKYLARATKESIDGFEYTTAAGVTQRPFQVDATPYPSGFDAEDVRDIDAAHASIVPTLDTTKSQIRKMGKVLGRNVFVCDPIDEDGFDPAETVITDSQSHPEQLEGSSTPA